MSCNAPQQLQRCMRPRNGRALACCCAWWGCRPAAADVVVFCDQQLRRCQRSDSSRALRPPAVLPQSSSPSRSCTTPAAMARRRMRRVPSRSPSRTLRAWRRGRTPPTAAGSQRPTARSCGASSRSCCPRSPSLRSRRQSTVRWLTCPQHFVRPFFRCDVLLSGCAATRRCCCNKASCSFHLSCGCVLSATATSWLSVGPFC